jgi:hypothetical protein
MLVLNLPALGQFQKQIHTEHFDFLSDAKRNHLLFRFHDTTFNNFGSTHFYKFYNENKGTPILRFFSCKLSGRARFMNTPIDNRFYLGPGTLQIDDSKIDTLTVSPGYNRVYLKNDSIKRMTISGFAETISSETEIPNDLISVDLSDSQIDHLTIQGGQINLHPWRSFFVKNKLEFYDVHLSGYFELYDAFPDTLIFVRSDLSKLDDALYLNVRDSVERKIFFWQTKLDNINIRYDKFRLFFPIDFKMSFEEKLFAYQELLNNVKKNGVFKSYEKLDKEFLEFKYTGEGKLWGFFLNFLDRHWWDYGYNKYLIIRNAIFLNMFFFLINIFLYDQLLKNGYSLKKFELINKKIETRLNDQQVRKFLYKVPYIYLYSSYIFWGLKLDMGSIKIKNIGLFSYVVIQYAIGVVCIGYLANLIIHGGA